MCEKKIVLCVLIFEKIENIQYEGVAGYSIHIV